MVEVFKTDVSNCDDAQQLIEQIHQKFTGYKANFDLDDCDLILRIESESSITAKQVIHLLAQKGFYAVVLEDDFQAAI